MIKIWGTSFSLIGDLVMSLPQLKYFKKKYQKTYINFVIHKKIAYCAPLFYNHPDIDKIIISGKWSSFGPEDYKIASECDVVTTKLDHKNQTILDRKHENYEVVEYLTNTPTAMQIKSVMKMLGTDARGIMRQTEGVYLEMDLDDEKFTDDMLVDIMVKNPILIQRPIIIKNGKAVIGRPTSNVEALLK